MDGKYIVFKRPEFLELTEPRAMNMATAQMHQRQLHGLVLPDAVVIRRQDFFASPTLAMYADCIGLVHRTTQDKDLSKRLVRVADYFRVQSELAAAEGWKFPD